VSWTRSRTGHGRTPFEPWSRSPRFHWVDPPSGSKKVARALKSGRVRHESRPNRAPADGQFFVDVQELLNAGIRPRRPGYGSNGPTIVLAAPLPMPRNAFGSPQIRRYETDIAARRAICLDVLRTYSSTNARRPAPERLADMHGPSWTATAG
jgi:hypothetical protein